jgi:3-hydroxyacyl-[acyl-carrier-protein] dehydratase
VPEVTRRVSVPGDHPSLAGHFPGNPIVPGVLLLELVAAAASEGIGRIAIGCVRAVKFAAPLRPDELADLHLDWDAHRIRFRCEREGTLLAQGTLEYTPA